MAASFQSISSTFLPSYSPAKVSVKFTVSCCSFASSPVTVVNGNADTPLVPRSEIRLGLPSKGRMAADTLDLLKVILCYCFGVL